MSKERKYNQLITPIENVFGKTLQELVEYVSHDDLQNVLNDIRRACDNFLNESENLVRKKIRKKATILWDILGEDLWASVFSFLEVKDLLECLMVSKYFKNVIENHPISVSSLPAFHDFRKSILFVERFLEKRFNNLKSIHSGCDFLNYCMKNKMVFRDCKKFSFKGKYNGKSDPSKISKRKEWWGNVSKVFPKVQQLVVAMEGGNNLHEHPVCSIVDQFNTEKSPLTGLKLYGLLKLEFLKRDNLFFVSKLKTVQEIHFGFCEIESVVLIVNNCPNLEVLSVVLMRIMRGRFRGDNNCSKIGGKCSLSNLRKLKIRFTNKKVDFMEGVLGYFSESRNLETFWFSIPVYITNKADMDRNICKSLVKKYVGEILENNCDTLKSLKVHYSFRKREVTNFKFKELSELECTGFSNSFLLRHIMANKMCDSLRSLTITFSTGVIFKQDDIYHVRFEILNIYTVKYPEYIEFQRFKCLKELSIGCGDKQGEVNIIIKNETLRKIMFGKVHYTHFRCRDLDVDCPCLEYLEVQCTGLLTINRNRLNYVDIPLYRNFYGNYEFITKNLCFKLPLINLKKLQIGGCQLQEPGSVEFTNLNQLTVEIRTFLRIKSSAMPKLESILLFSGNKKKLDVHHSVFIRKICLMKFLSKLVLEDFSFSIFRKRGVEIVDTAKRSRSLKEIEIKNFAPESTVSFKEFMRKLKVLEKVYIKRIRGYGGKYTQKERNVDIDIFLSSIKKRKKNIKWLALKFGLKKGEGTIPNEILSKIKSLKNLEYLKLISKCADGRIKDESKQVKIENSNVITLVIMDILKYVSLSNLHFPKLRTLCVCPYVDIRALIVGENILEKFPELEMISVVMNEDKDLKQNVKASLEDVFQYLTKFKNGKLKVLSFMVSNLDKLDILMMEKKFLGELNINLRIEKNFFACNSFYSYEKRREFERFEGIFDLETSQ